MMTTHTKREVRELYAIRLAPSEIRALERAATRLSRGQRNPTGPRSLAANLVAAGVKKILENPVDTVATA